MDDADRPFVITVRRTWTLWILPGIAALYFLAVVLLNLLNYRIEGVSNDMLVLGGLALFVLVILIELPFFMRRRRPKAPKAKKTKAAPAPVEEAAPATAMDSTRNGWDDELQITGESQQGLQVIEYSAPAKSRNANAVYTKTYVPVSGAHVLRIETLAAEQRDL